MTDTTTESPLSTTTELPDTVTKKSTGPVYVKVASLRGDGPETTCLRPVHMCTLGGCCDICWHNPDNRKKRKG